MPHLIAHAEVIGYNGKIKGGCPLKDREGTIRVLDLAGGARLNPEAGLESRGQFLHGSPRNHETVTLCKERDISTPYLLKALTSAEPLFQVIIRCYRINAQGHEEHYYTITLENALVKGMIQSHELEYLSFDYEKITWRHEQEGIEAEDSWQMIAAAGGVPVFAGLKTLKESETKGDVQVVFVDKDSLEIVPNIKARINYPDGRFKELVSGRTGSITLPNVDEGQYTLSGYTDKLSNVHRGNAVAFVDLKNQAGSESQSFKPPSKNVSDGRHYTALSHICKIREYNVNNGDLFSQVAKSNGFTFEELAFFNWGTRNRSSFMEQEKMRFECGDIAPSGNEYTLKSGVIYIPEPVTSTGIPTRTPHVAYIQRPGTRPIALSVTTSTGNPVPNVTATLTLSDQSTYTAKTAMDGKGCFTSVPADLEGKVTYDDEDDLIARHYAADIRAAAQTPGLDRMLLYLQSAVDFVAVNRVYQESYGTDAGKEVLAAFKGDEDEDVIELYLLKTGLIDRASFSLKSEGGRA